VTVSRQWIERRRHSDTQPRIDAVGSSGGDSLLAHLVSVQHALPFWPIIVVRVHDVENHVQ
jgi:hypothetical protein